MNAISPYLGIVFYVVFFGFAVYFLRENRLDSKHAKENRVFWGFLAISSFIAVVLCVLDIKGVI